jgi:hypothetical protein
MRNRAPAVDENMVLTGDGSFAKNGFEESNAKIPALAAVSPKRAVKEWRD